MKNYNKVKGLNGEEIAKKYIKSQRFKILELNYSNFCGEIDIIALDNDCYVFIEVKTRSSLDFGRPGEAVNKFKQNHIKKTAQAYMILNKIKNVPVRFDVIEVLPEEINHIRNAFW